MKFIAARASRAFRLLLSRRLFQRRGRPASFDGGPSRRTRHARARRDSLLRASWPAAAAHVPIPSASAELQARSADAPRCGRWRRSGILVDDAAVTRRNGKMHEADRLARRCAAGTVRCPVIETARSTSGFFERTDRHLDRGLLADRTETVERRSLDAEHRVLGGIGIGDEAAIDHVGRAGNFGQCASDESRRCRTRRSRSSACGCGRDRAARGRGLVRRSLPCQSIQGRRMVAAAVAAMPSSRPVKPRRSLVVAFTATRTMPRRRSR